MSLPDSSNGRYADITNRVRQRQQDINGVDHSSPTGRDATYLIRQNLANEQTPGVQVPGSNSCTESKKLDIPDFEPNRKRPRVSKLDGQQQTREPLITNTKLRAAQKEENSLSGPKKVVKKVVKTGRKLPQVNHHGAADQLAKELEDLPDVGEDLEQLKHRERWAMLSALRDLAPWHRASSCCRVPIPHSVHGVEGVQLLQQPKNGDQKARARFGNVAQCGSVWICPVCSARIARKRSEEVNRALTRHIDEGGTLMHITLTHRHTRDDVLTDQLERQGKAFQDMHRQRNYRKLCASNGVIGTIKALELTHSDANGWHVHVHLLVLLAGNEGQAARHAEHMTDLDAKRANWSGKKREPVPPAKVSKLHKFGRDYISLWREAADQHGLFAAWDGQNAEIASCDEKSLERLAGYLTKHDTDGKNYENIEAFDDDWELFDQAVNDVHKAGTGTTSGAAKEIALGALKVSRKESGKTPFQYLKEYAFEKDPAKRDYAGALFAEFAAAIHGRSALSWSRGLKDFFDIATLSDEEIAKEDERSQQPSETLVGQFSPYEWRAILAGPRLARSNILEMAKNLDLKGITAYLATLLELFESRTTGPPA